MTDKVLTETAIWLARIERGLTLEEGTQLREWLRQPAHRDSIVNAAKLYHGADVVAVLGELVPVGFGNPPPPLPRQPRTFAIVVAVCLAVFAVLPIVAIRHMPRLGNAHYRPPLPRDEQIYDTRVREIRSVKLPDSSEAILNGQSQLYVLYTASGRSATLGHGEVLFDVLPKWPGPLDVFAGGRHFVAQSGRFDLRVINPQVVELAVVSGNVTVKALPFRRPTTPQQAREFDPRVFADANVGPMQSARLDSNGLIRHELTAAELRSQLGWEPEQVVYVSP